MKPDAPGRNCPLDYRYGAAALAGPAAFATDCLWVAGGLYGNTLALDRLQQLFAPEAGSAKLVFNGDFHWFDVADDQFDQIEQGVAQHAATRGNVEAELAQPHAGAGCGCGYPDWVGDGEVERSNRIIERLKATAARSPGATARLGALPMHLVVEVGGIRVGIVHGDADALAGWGFAQEVLATDAGCTAARAAFTQANVALFASSHTCLPVMQAISGGGLVANNGAAGMPNFAGTTFGLATRIAQDPSARALYRSRAGPLYVEAIPIDYDAKAWNEIFLAQWPPGSDAHLSYHRRIVAGPDFGPEQARRAA